MDGFAPATARWFTDALGEPTTVQLEAWDAIRAGGHALVVAPTGSGKTLAAFLHAIDRLLFHPHSGGTRVVYVSPLKALGVDVERNLRIPLAGIRSIAGDARDVTVGVRSGDTPQRERARLKRNPPDILITTPESLYLMLTSSARDTLRDVETVIVDEIHAIAGDKRGTHLTLSLERLDLLVGRDVQRIALSATVRPIDAVARFLGGDRDVDVINPPADKRWDVAIRTPNLADPWPEIEERILDDILAARSTLVFTNARRTAETLTGHLNERWAERGGEGFIARTHHGSVSRHLREEIESALKLGELRAVVATATLELGIDMGAVEQVIQVGSPPSASSALQRIGRAGHRVGATSWGRIETLHRGELAAAVVTTGDLLEGRIEELHIPILPLDVLAQQTAAEAAAHPEVGLDIGRWLKACRRAFPYRDLTRRGLDDVLSLLLGTYPSADFSDLKARLSMHDGRLLPLRGTQRLAVTSGGTIPDHGLYGVFLDEAGDGRRVGELDEEMVWETRVGETFTLGASSWTVTAITRDQVRVVPAPPLTGKMPFWRNEEPARPAELGRRIGDLNRDLAAGRNRLDVPWLDEATRRELLTYVRSQAAATGVVPDSGVVVVERCRDELGDWRVIVHSPLGRAVLMPWAAAVAGLIAQRSGVDARPVVADDGFILRLPDGDLPGAVADLIRIDPDRIERLVVDNAAGTGQFAARFREAAARALLLPRRFGRRMPLWQQRNRAAQLQQVARDHPRFPITLEAVRELLHDQWDLPALTDLLRDIAWERVRVVDLRTETPSPFAATLLHRYAGAFMYEGDLPVQVGGGRGLGIDAESLSAVGVLPDLTRVFDEEIAARITGELQRTLPGDRARDIAELIELPRRLGPLTRDELAARSDIAIPDPLPEGLVEVDVGGPRIAAASDLPLLASALGIPVATSEPAPSGRDPLTQLIARFARTRAAFQAEDLAAAFGLSAAVARKVLDAEVAARRLVTAHLRTHGIDYCDPDVFDRLTRACQAKARSAITPLPQRAYARYVISELHRVGSCDSLQEALLRLAGTIAPASLWETHLLPARCSGYRPVDLDLLLAQGGAVIRIFGDGDDPPIAILDPEDLDLLPLRPEPDDAAVEFATRLGDGTICASEAEAAWHAAAAGTIAPASLEPLRRRLAPHRVKGPPPRRPARLRLARPSRPLRGPETLPGRWYAVADPQPDAGGQLTVWLAHHGLVTKQIADGIPGGWSAVYRDLRQVEAQGFLDRGVFVDGLPPAQFAPPDFLSRSAPYREACPGSAQLLAALDPANPYGAVLPWPDHPSARPTRAPGALVVVLDGRCLAYLGRGGRSLALFSDEATAVADALLRAVAADRLGRFRIAEIDGERATAHPSASRLLAAGARIHPQGLVFET